jgi:hypothetical protein
MGATAQRQDAGSGKNQDSGTGKFEHENLISVRSQGGQGAHEGIKLGLA